MTGPTRTIVLWTFIELDWDLLRDDLEAADNFPFKAWATRDEARKACEEQHAAIINETDASEWDSPKDKADAMQLQWEESESGVLTAEIAWNAGPGGTRICEHFYRVYPIEWEVPGAITFEPVGI